MARIKYQPATRLKQFNPIQLSKEGITQMRRDSDRMIQGLQQNFQAEKEQQARDRAAMQENAALTEDRINRDRAIEVENLKNQQISLSQQIAVDTQQSKFDAEAQNTILNSLVNFSKTIAETAAARTAKQLKDQTQLASQQDTTNIVNQIVNGSDIEYDSVEQLQITGGIIADADTQENAIETNEQLLDTRRAYASNPALGDVGQRVLDGRILVEAFPLMVGKALRNSEAIYDDGAGNKFSGVEALRDPTKIGIVSSEVEQALYQRMGVNSAKPGRFSKAITTIQEQKYALQKNANEKALADIDEVIEQQAVDHASADTTQGYTLSFHKRQRLSNEQAHAGVVNQISDPSTDLEAIDRMDLMGNGKRYSQTWPKRWELGLAQRRANETQAINANIKFRKAQRDQFELDNIDIIREAFNQNPTQAFRAAQEQAYSQGLTVSERVKGIHTAAIADKKDQELAVLQTKLRFSSLDKSYVNSIQDPTVRKQGIKDLAQQEEQKYGPAALGIKKGFRATARKLTNINPNEGNDSPQTFLVQARLESEYLKQLEITQDPIAANAKVNEMLDKAAAGDKTSPFYKETGTNNRLVFTNIETVDTDLSEKNLMIDKRMTTFGASVASQPFVLATSEEMDATMISAQSGGDVTYSKGILRAAEKFGLKPSEVFNAQRQANNLVTGENKPLLTPSIGTETVDAMDPATLKYYTKAKEFNSHMSALNANARFTGTVNNNVRSSMQQVYTVGNIGPTSTGPHLDVKRVDGGRFEANALDEYVVVNDPEFGNISLGEIRKRTGGIGDNWDQHVSRGSHGIDYGIHEGTGISITNGAKVVSNSPTEHGDYLIIELPSGDRYSFLHGKGMM